LWLKTAAGSHRYGRTPATPFVVAWTSAIEVVSVLCVLCGKSSWRIRGRPALRGRPDSSGRGASLGMTFCACAGMTRKCARLTPPTRLNSVRRGESATLRGNDGARKQKGQGKSIRRLALTFILKQNAEPCVSPSRHGNNYGIGNDRPCAIEEFSRSCAVGKNYRLAKKIGRALAGRARPHSTGSCLEPYSPVGARQGTGNGLPDEAGFWIGLVPRNDWWGWHVVFRGEQRPWLLDGYGLRHGHRGGHHLARSSLTWECLPRQHRHADGLGTELQAR
jgi:hypothetical protein